MSTNISYYFSNLEEFPFKDWFLEMKKTWEPLAKIETFLDELLVKPDVREMRGTLKSGNVHFYGNYYVGENTVIYNDVTIMGPVYIGKNCKIMPGAIIRPNTIIADDCEVGHGSEVKHCLVMNGAKIASLAFAGDSILGKSARLGSGVITANRKFNQTNATLRIEGERYDLGRSFFGCVLGDNARLGANSVTQPGTHIGPYTWIFPLTNVRGFIPRQLRVYEKRNLVTEENEIIDLQP